ncbi:hypothetical protein [Salipiger sp. PrR003]|uniref:hypothetical protein n=1 Tax=Salipiger sp. PrR003 TaxID=2706776 RepID=UPI0013D8FE5D|nr:hypothetical protein [Salipiger sp. PrR003]NDV50361.1 hypothetical protein [Salipiger sp. PrR003]
MKDIPTEYLEPEKFVTLARDILDGEREFEDERMLIRRDFQDLDLEIRRKSLPGKRGTNPVTMVKNGEIIRHHGEHVYLTQHMKGVARDLYAIRPARRAHLALRKVISPKTHREMADTSDVLITFQEQSKEAMAEELLRLTRTLIDSGLFEIDHKRSYDEWLLLRVAPAIAKCLNPEIELRQEEIATLEEAEEDHVTFIADGDTDKMAEAAKSIMRNYSLMRAAKPGVPDDIRRACDILIRPRPNALSIAVDTVKPGSYPNRAEKDDREPLPGIFVIATDEHEHDHVVEYRDEMVEAERDFDLAIAHRAGEELSREDMSYARALANRASEITREDIVAFTLQDGNGDYLREHKLEIQADAPAPGFSI